MAMAGCRMRWVEAMDIMPDGPEKALVRAAGRALSTSDPNAMTRLGEALDALVDKVIEENPIDVSSALISR